MIDGTWLPRTPREALIKADAILADIVPRIADARRRITDVLPGHSGRPAGTGEPGGGRGASDSCRCDDDANCPHGTVVERLALRRPPELRDLERIDQLVDRIVDHAHRITATPPLQPANTSPARQLTYARWLIRNHPIHNRHTVPHLYDDIAELDNLIDQWAAPRPGGKRTQQLAVDDTGTWCRSCLRAGHRNTRDRRYPTLGLCRWCGDYHAAQRILPTLDILDAHESGSPLEVARLIRDGEKRTTRRRKRAK